MKCVFFEILVLFKCSVYALEYNFDGDVRNFVVGKSKVYVVTDSRLHQLRFDLVEEKYKDLSNHSYPNKVSILLPFDANGTLITCGTYECGYCEVLDINDITKIIYREKLSVIQVNQSLVALLIGFDKGNGVKHNGTYLLLAREKSNICNYQDGIVLWNTLQSQVGDIFSDLSESSSPYVETKEDIEWVDGFQTSAPSHSYVFLNVKSPAPSVMFLRMNNNGKKTEMTRSLKGAKLECCDDKPRRKLLSSAVISSGSPLLWVGIFTSQEEHDDTALAIFDISDPGSLTHFTCIPACTSKENYDKVLKPESVVFKHSSMTSVAAQQTASWIVLYIGTGSGQLIKLVLDKTFRSGCTMVLYRSGDDRMLFPRMHFDPVDHKYIYIALRNQIRRVAVTQCNMYSTLRDCRASLDPLCGWCLNTNKCSTQDECSRMSAWISIPDSFQKETIFYQLEKHSGNLTVTLHLNMEATGHPPLSCSFKSGSKDLCEDLPTAVFPKCSCSFSSQDLPSEGLQVIATITIGDETLTESLNLKNCTDISETSAYAKCSACVSSGCHWSSSNQTCTWNQRSALQVHIQDVCKELPPGKNRPEIFSLQPSRVSFHGKNNVVVKGKNLEQVVKIRLQGVMDCNPKETPVLERTNDTLRFHIPSGNKGTVRVCVVTADGSCHSNATITYGSQPTCTGLEPQSTWASGGRRIQVLGTNLKYVEKITLHTSGIEMSVMSTTEGLWFHSPPVKVGQGYVPVSVSLWVGNSTVDCVHKLSYHPDPQLTDFSTSQDFTDLLIFIHKKKDMLNLIEDDMKVWGLQDEQHAECVIQQITATFIICKIVATQEDKVNSLQVTMGYFSTVVQVKGKRTMDLFCVQSSP